MAELSRPLLERVIASKYILQQARIVLSSEAPFAPGIAVGQAQDAVEMFLRILAEHFHVAVKERVAFDQLVEAVNNVLPAGQTLSFRTSLNQLNKARVGFKHFGLEPTHKDAEKLVADMEAFLPTTYTQVFSKDYSTVSLRSLLQHRRSENWLQRAEEEIVNGRYQEAIDSSAAALAVFRHHLGIESKRVRLDRFDELRKQGLSGFADSVKAEFASIHSELELIFAGTNLQQYVLFRRFARWVSLSMAGTLHFGSHPFGEVEPSREHALACLSFVTDTALALRKASPPGRFLPKSPVVSRTLEVIARGEIIVYPEADPEVIRVVEPGEKLPAPADRAKVGYQVIIQDDEFAFIAETCVRELPSGAT